MNTYYQRFKDPDDRFWEKVLMTETCWIWKGAKSKDGYGVFGYTRKVKRAHRYVYERYIGSIPKGKYIDHLCRNRACVNPFHLELVTNEQNIKRSPLWAGNKTHCPQGHEYNDKNTRYSYSKGYKCRHCRECERIGMRKKYNKKIASAEGVKET